MDTENTTGTEIQPPAKAAKFAEQERRKADVEEQDPYLFSTSLDADKSMPGYCEPHTQADAIKPAAEASDPFEQAAYKEAVKAAKAFSEGELSNYKFRVSSCRAEILIEQLPFVRKVKVITKVNGVRKVESVLKYWAPTYKAKGRTFNDKEAAFEVGMNYGLLLALAFREGAYEHVVERVIREAYAAHANSRDHYGTLVGGFICQIENQIFRGMRTH